MTEKIISSSLSWLDFAEDDRRKMMEVVSLFKLRETRDELGFGSIRNTFAEMLFPGTGTMQTRARYFLIIPWIYLHLEKNRVPSSKIGERVRQQESWIISTLMKGDTDGVIGRISGPRINRLPSNIYWYGLVRWGIFRHDIGQWQYHRSLDRSYRIRHSGHTTDDGEPLDWNQGVNWDPGIPNPPRSLYEDLTLSLTKKEAEYLQDRVRLHCNGSMLPFLIDSGVPLGDVDFAWFHPNAASIPDDLGSMLSHARNFSELIYGAALLYNYLLAEVDKREELIEAYEPELDRWYDMISVRLRDFQKWDQAAFWTLVTKHGRIPAQTQSFVRRWINTLLGGKDLPRIEKDKKARRLVRSREISLKRGRSRFKSKQHRELWGGAAGNFQLDFRWWVTKRLVNDIIDGLRGE